MSKEGLSTTNKIKPTEFNVITTNNKGVDQVTVANLPPGARGVIFDADELRNTITRANDNRSPEKLKVEEGIPKQNPEITAKEINNKNEALIVKQLGNLESVEKLRNDLDNIDSYPGELRKEDTDKINKEKMELQETLTGMEQQTAETQSTQQNLEENIILEPQTLEEQNKALNVAEEVRDTIENDEDYDVENDPRFREQFEKEAFFRLKTYDKDYFDKNYSGIGEDGYLIDLNGQKTMSRPSMNIGGKTGDLKYSEFVKIEKQKFFTKNPEALQKQRKAEEKKAENEKATTYEDPGEDPALRDISSTIDELMKTSNSPRGVVYMTYLENFIKDNPEKAEKYIAAGDAQYGQGEYKPEWYENLLHVNEIIERDKLKKEAPIVEKEINTTSVKSPVEEAPIAPTVENIPPVEQVEVVEEVDNKIPVLQDMENPNDREIIIEKRDTNELPEEWKGFEKKWYNGIVEDEYKYLETSQEIMDFSENLANKDPEYAKRLSSAVYLNERGADIMKNYIGVDESGRLLKKDGTTSNFAHLFVGASMKRFDYERKILQSYAKEKGIV